MPNLDWFLGNFDALAEKYSGEWLAIQDEVVIAHHASAAELGRQIRELGPVRVFITRAALDAWVSIQDHTPVRS